MKEIKEKKMKKISTPIFGWVGESRNPPFQQLGVYYSYEIE